LEKQEAVRLRIQVCSDLHVEFYANWEEEKRECALDELVDPCADYLALLGDIGLACTPLYSAFLLRVASRFKGVYVLLGNHEYYRNTVQGTLGACQEVCDSHPNLHLVQRSSFLLEGVRVLGTTLWSHVPNADHEVVFRCMNDYRRIHDDTVQPTTGLHVTATNRWHADEVAFLRDELAKAKTSDEPVLVLTHHAPLSGMGCSNPGEWF
jgi:predicted MPP superfamily phosphohydrolase